MRRRAKVVVRKNRPQCAVFAADIQKGVRVPALNGSLRASPVLTPRIRPESIGRRTDGLRAAERNRLKTLTMIACSDCHDAVAHLFRGQRAVLIVPAVGGAIRRCDVKLHQVDMLPDDVRRRAHLKIIEFVVVWHQVREPKLNHVTAVRSEEERLRGARTVQSVGHI